MAVVDDGGGAAAGDTPKGATRDPERLLETFREERLSGGLKEAFDAAGETTATATEQGAHAFEQNLKEKLKRWSAKLARRDEWRRILRERPLGAPRYEMINGMAPFGKALLPLLQLLALARVADEKKQDQHDAAGDLVLMFVDSFLVFHPQKEHPEKPAGDSGQLMQAWDDLDNYRANEPRPTEEQQRDKFVNFLGAQMDRCRGDQKDARDPVLANLTDRLKKKSLKAVAGDEEHPLFHRRGGREGYDDWYAGTNEGLDADPPTDDDMEPLIRFASGFRPTFENYELDADGDPAKLPSVFSSADLEKLVGAARDNLAKFNLGTLRRILRQVLVSLGVSADLGTFAPIDDEEQGDGAVLNNPLERTIHESRTDLEELPGHQQPPDQLVLGREGPDREAVASAARRLLGELKEHERGALRLRSLGRSSQEIGELYGVTSTAVNNWKREADEKTRMVAREEELESDMATRTALMRELVRLIDAESDGFNFLEVRR